MPCKPKEIDDGILKYATDIERKYIEYYNKLKSMQKVSDELGISKSCVSRGIQRAEKRAAQSGYAPAYDMTHEVAPGMLSKGTTTLYNKDGEIVLQWVKTGRDEENKLQLVLDSISTLTEDLRGKSILHGTPDSVRTDIIAIYPMADPHFGLYAWMEETGENFDLEIAETNLLAAMNRLISRAPPTEIAIIANLGDFFHSDNMSNMTPKSGNVLDVDSRWAKVIRVGIRALKTCVELALQKHESVIVFNEIGNHDIHSSVILSTVMDAYFENNPRVHIVTEPKKFHYYKFGKNLIGFTHGDTVKPEMLGQIMATDKPKEWGETVHRGWLTGHIHHRTVLELPGCTVETFNTLAAADAWTSSMGFRSLRNMSCIILHKDHGVRERYTVDIGELKEEYKKTEVKEND